MEGSKNAMYAQAGRSRGWTQGMPDSYAPPKMPSIPDMPVRPITPAMPVETKITVETEMFVEQVTPVMPVMPAMPPIPTPPVVVVPEAKKSAKDCQTLAMAYVPMQKWQDVYEPEQGFSRGTIFTELDLPFVGEGACSHE